MKKEMKHDNKQKKRVKKVFAIFVQVIALMGMVGIKHMAYASASDPMSFWNSIVDILQMGIGILAIAIGGFGLIITGFSFSHNDGQGQGQGVRFIIAAAFIALAAWKVIPMMKIS